jgi:hypothetical protein
VIEPRVGIERGKLGAATIILMTIAGLQAECSKVTASLTVVQRSRRLTLRSDLQARILSVLPLLWALRRGYGHPETHSATLSWR